MSGVGCVQFCFGFDRMKGRAALLLFQRECLWGGGERMGIPGMCKDRMVWYGMVWYGTVRYGMVW